MLYVTYIVHLILVAARSKYRLGRDFSRKFSSWNSNIWSAIIPCYNFCSMFIFLENMSESLPGYYKSWENKFWHYMSCSMHVQIRWGYNNPHKGLVLDKTQGITITYMALTSSENNFWHSNSFEARHQSLDPVIKVTSLL